MVIEQCFVLDDQQFDGMSSFEVVVQPICQDQAKNLRGPTLQKHRSIIFNQVNRRSEMKALIGSVLALGVMGSAYAQVNCNTFLNNTINRAVNQDVLASGYTCTIARTGFVNGNVIQTGEGSLVIRGVVNGGVSESGNGNVDVNGGNVGGDISERDAGNLLVRNGGSFNGTLEEAGGGYVKVTVTGGGANKGDIFETGAG